MITNMLLFKILIAIFGAFIGVLCGTEDSIVGGYYEDALEQCKVDYLNKHSLLFYIANKMTYVTALIGTPLLMCVLLLIYVLFLIFAPEFTSNFICENEKIIGVLLITYLIFLLIFYFVGYCVAGKIQEKLLKDYENS